MCHIEIIYRSTVYSLFGIFGLREARCIRENCSNVVQNAELFEAPVAEINVKIFNPTLCKGVSNPIISASQDVPVRKMPLLPEYGTSLKRIPIYGRNILSADEKDIPIQKALPSRFGYLLRPYIHLHGQVNGYQWEQGRRGLWREFLLTQCKNYTLQCTGNMSS